MWHSSDCTAAEYLDRRSFAMTSPCIWSSEHAPWVVLDRTTYTILAAVAFDETGECALREATRTAEHHSSSELHVVHVLSDQMPSESYGDPSGLHLQLADALEQLRARVEGLTASRTLPVQGHIRVGTAVRCILELAAEIEADLVVLGTDRHMRLRKFVLGSVAESVLRESHCAVLVAMRKDYPALARSARAVCTACLELRASTANATQWCERHCRAYTRLNVCKASDGS